MLSWWHRLFHRGRQNSDEPDDEPLAPSGGRGELLEQLEKQFEKSPDVKFRRFQLGESGPRGAVVYIEGYVDGMRLEMSTLRPLMVWANRLESAIRADPRGGVPAARHLAGRTLAHKKLIIGLESIGKHVLAAAEWEIVDGLEVATAALLMGDTLLVLEGEHRALHISNRGPQARGVEDPISEVTIRGPRDSFTETLFWNTALIRRRLKDPNMRIILKKIGRRSRTDVAVVYIEGITPPDLVDEVSARLEAIDIDAILDTGYIEQLIEDSWLSPFPQHLKTERPDKVVAGLLIGRVALIADTTPFVLMMPATLDSFFHSPEDSYDRYFQVNILRALRLGAATFSTLIPGLYVALVAYHPGILPTELTLQIHQSREGVAFPVLVEALIMQAFLELIKEAGFRLPGPLGQTFGIVGGLILGDIGIRAGIVSEAMVITVAATAISSFASVDREIGTVLRLLGLPVMLSTAVLGLYGFIMAVLLIAIHLATLRSYGIPYLAPYPYYKWSAWKDAMTKAPLRTFRRRPKYMAGPNLQRQQPVQPPPEDEAHDRGRGS